MVFLTHVYSRPLLLGTALLGLTLTTGCGAPQMTESGALAPTAPETAEAVASKDSEAIAAAPSDAISTNNGVAVPRRTQLIKQASLEITLDDVDSGVEATQQLLVRYQGDLLSLSDQTVDQSGQPRQIQIQMRVPQENLDAVLAELKSLGAVRQQAITAEDVSTQLVDLQARVRNLQKSEEALLEIMERSGSIADVLAVSQELSAVREGIERTDAQLKNLQNQVAFSTITLLFESTAPIAPSAPVLNTLGDTWQTASQSVRGFTVGLLQIFLWLLVYSPYLAIALLIIGGGYRLYRHQPRPSHAPSEETPS